MYFTKDNINNIGVDDFVRNYYKELQGAAIFVKNKKSRISRIISKFCKGQIKLNFLKDFVPSHIASCYKDSDEKLYILDIKPPKSSAQELENYLKNTSDDYVICLRQVKLNLDKYNKYMRERIGLHYGFISAIQSIFKRITFKHGMHCSENYIYAYNQQGYYYDINANKSTPANLLTYLVEKDNEKESV